MSYKPLLFFSCIALLLAVIGLVLVLPVFAEYFATGLVPKFPTLIFSGFLLMAALILYITGLSLENECKKSKQNFEIQMNLLALLRDLREGSHDKTAH